MMNCTICIDVRYFFHCNHHLLSAIIVPETGLVREETDPDFSAAGRCKVVIVCFTARVSASERTQTKAETDT